MKKEWKSLRESFKRALTNRKNQTRSGAAGKKLSTCKYFNNLNFLTDVVSHAPTETNIDLNITTTPIGSSLKSSNNDNANKENENQLVIQHPYRKKTKKENTQEKIDLLLVNTLKDITNTSADSSKEKSPKQLFHCMAL